MKLDLYYSCWGHETPAAQALPAAASGGFDGIEGAPPEDAGERRDLATQLEDEGLHYIGEIVTGGDYCPEPWASVDQHLEDLKRQLERILEMGARRATCLFGLDAWPLRDQLVAYEQALECVGEADLPVSFETHRSRPTFSPWATRELLSRLPDLRLTADFSHWCVVSERLVIDDDPALFDLIAARCDHIHARVGYAQGPQVPDPRAEEYGSELKAHLGWWRQLWRRREDWTMTPEFGPDGYQQKAPFTGDTAAELSELNHWMAGRLRRSWETAVRQ